MRLLVLALLAAGAAPAHSAPDTKTREARLAEATRGGTPGEPVSCITQFPMLDSTVIEGIGILYRRGSEMYLNRFTSGCRISFSDALVTRTPTEQLCRGDIATVVDTTTRIQHDSCTFGDFIPYTRGPAK